MIVTALAQGAMERAKDSPSFWPLTLIGAVLAIILSTWTLLGRISARFNSSLDVKLAPLATQIKQQGERAKTENERLEAHINNSIKKYDDDCRAGMNGMAKSLRDELKTLSEKHAHDVAAVAERHNDLALKVSRNATLVEQHTADLQESKMDRAQLRRELDQFKNTLASIEATQERSQEKILHAIEQSRDKLSNNQGDFSQRLTRVEEALKFYARVRTDRPE